MLAALARVAIRSGVSPIPFYLLGGVALGALGPIDLPDSLISVGGSIGVVLLLFMLGLEYSGQELQSNLRTGLPAGVLDVALNFTPGLVFGLLLGWDPVAAVLLGGVTWISSSGVVAKLLVDLNRMGNRETPAVLSILVLEDLAMTVYLPVVAALLVGGGIAAAMGSIAIALGAAALALVVALRFGGAVSRAVSHRSGEVVLLGTFGLVLVVAGGAERLQVSAAVGAFLVGIALSGDVAHQAAELLSPLRDLFAAGFFLFFGLTVDAAALPGVLGVAVALAAVTAVTKMATGWWAARRIGVGVRGRARAAGALVARGEFSVVIAGLGVAQGIEADLGPTTAAYVLVLAVAGPLLARYADRLVPRSMLTPRPRPGPAEVV
ncbi:MAG: cation:proton antiporter, partial [Thermoleophilia bacterium]|nr:cation:proton antiporter [Thermoleophilia bacterium]